AVAYFVAGFFLWWGWKLFVPAAETPFGYAIPPTHAIANIYFLADKSWYFGAPIVVGLGIAVIAVRQRLKHLWPTIGLGLDACVGATARIHAGRSVASGLGHISMSFFSIHSSGAAAYGELLYAAAIFLLSMLPYLAWSLWKAYPLAE
ncbi:MAG: hypothetical protein ACRD5K_05530, partial [Candidatus Acidiferrales bacterium]